MLGHFDKLSTPLKSVHTYPTLECQQRRFSSRGWGSVAAWTLWQAWADPKFLSPDERCGLDEVEPFDEWEEFALFGSHYCLIHATTSLSGDSANGNAQHAGDADITTQQIKMQVVQNPEKKVQRRFGASFSLVHSRGGDLVNFLGLGTSSRLESYDVFRSLDTSPELRGLSDFTEGPSGRMCHTITPNGLLVGGRTSPLTPLKDCWLLTSGECRRLLDLPRPLYRHSAVRLDYRENSESTQPQALLIGGKEGPSSVFDGAYVLSDWHQEWTGCKIAGEAPVPVSGAFCMSFPGLDGGGFRGIYGGGIRDDGVISDQLLAWSLHYDSEVGVSDFHTILIHRS